MKICCFVFIILGFSLVSAIAQESCLTTENLIEIDTSWEKAQLELDHSFLELLLADEFIWVHNHANTIDDKTAVLERVNRYIRENNRNTRSRVSGKVEVITLGTTGIVSGFTIVDRDPAPTTYHFMRTYIESNGQCLLLANHTMAVPENE